MNSNQIMQAVTLIVVLAIATGQLLFKAAADAWQQAGTIWALPVVYRLLIAFAIYGIATLAWVWVLKHVPLNFAYPVIALTFVIVPVGAKLLFGEALGMRYLLGSGLIIAGIIVATSKGQ